MTKPKSHGKTSTLEILGTARPEKQPRKWGEYFTRLSDLRDAFLNGKKAHSSSAKEELPWFGEHMADAATDSYDRDCSLALLSSTQNALYEVDQALKRIKDGTYGVCELTGEPIETERLKAIPWTRYCIEAQAQIEAHRGGARVQLGPVGSCMNSKDGADSEEEAEDTGRELDREAA